MTISVLVWLHYDQIKIKNSNILYALYPKRSESTFLASIYGLLMFAIYKQFMIRYKVLHNLSWSPITRKERQPQANENQANSAKF